MRKFFHTYALTRPSIRFSLRLQDSKKGQNDWTYAPKAGASVLDAVMKVVSKDCARRCSEASTDWHGFSIQACLPRLDAVPQHISGKCQYLMIDGRPVLARRGFLKQIVSLFREKLARVRHDLQSLRDPFSGSTSTAQQARMIRMSSQPKTTSSLKTENRWWLR